MSVAPPPIVAPLEEPIKRDPTGWICLAVIFVLLIAITFLPQPTENAKADLGEAQPVLRSAISGLQSPHPTQVEDARKTLEGLEEKFVAMSKTDPEAAEIYITCRSLLGKKISKADLEPMAKSKDPLDRAAAEGFSKPKLDIPTAVRLSSRFQKRGFLGDVMKAQLYAKAGDKHLLNQLADQSMTSLFVVSGIVLLLAFGSFAAWIYLISLKSSGRLYPKGIPVRLPTLLDADRLAIRAAQLVTLFLVLGFIPESIASAVHRKLDSRVDELIVGIGMLIAVPFLFKVPIQGRVFTLTDIGVRRETLARDIKLGLFGFLIEFPLAIALGAIGQRLFSAFHQSTHPATVALQGSHDWLTVGSIIVAASVVAPFWEEIMFRGLLFPAFSKVTGKVVYGVILSSFLFGAIHPQGFPLWMALMALAGVSCALSYYTNSLVPSMFMHAAHNSFIVALTLLLS